MLPYAAAILLGSFLFFQIEPIIGKFILPWFGGGPGVWATCLVFFQCALVAGYGYAHVLTTRCAPRTQAIVHSALLAAALALLPIIPGEHWKPDPLGHPALQILALLTAVLGLPYVVLSATGPLVQEWCRRRQPDRSPYRLYALSNAGSLLALVSYPFFFEWYFPRRAQAHGWAAGCAVFAAVCGWCAWRSVPKASERSERVQRVVPTRSEAGVERVVPTRLDAARGQSPKRMGTMRSTRSENPESRVTIMLWLLLPAVGSALLLATTNKLCLDLAAAPFLWVLPLALYLLSFTLCFDHPRWHRPTLWTALAVMGAGCVGKLLFDDDAPLLAQVLVYTAGLFACCMVCHGELHRLRPEPHRLTWFYLLVAVGGALGGLFVAVAAPALFHSFAELPIAYWLVMMIIALACVARRRVELAHGTAIGAVAGLLLIPLVNAPAASNWRAFWHGARGQYGEFGAEFLWPIGLLLAAVLGCFLSRRDGWSRGYTLRGGLFAVGVAATVGGAYAVQARHEREDVVSAARSFFGVLTVFSYADDDPREHYYLLMHGRTTHGAQFTDPAKSRRPTTYYGATSGVGRAIDSLPPGPRRLGLVGLGAGTLAAYLRPGDTMRIYEINPQVEALARTRFTYLAQALGRVSIVTGDARLSLEREARGARPPPYDVLALDAFSSDAIPVHLLTEEAFALYLQELAPDGILAVHISNRFFDLEPVVANLARHFRVGCVVVDDEGDDDAMTYETTWVLLCRDPNVLLRPLIARAAEPAAGDRSQRLWTDDYSSLWQVLR